MKYKKAQFLSSFNFNASCTSISAILNSDDVSFIFWFIFGSFICRCRHTSFATRI